MKNEPKDASRKINTSLKNMMQELLSAQIKVPEWKFTLRASGLPICQYHACLSKVYEKVPDERPPQTRDFRFDYYTSVGTAVHTVYQRWLGRLGYLFGDYECTKCKNIVREHLGWPKSCPTENCTGDEWDYIEIELHDVVPGSELASAHCDGLLHFPWMEENHYYLVDFKTCSLSTLPDPKARLTNPYHIKYLTQLGFYHYLLTKRGYNIDGSLLYFVPRDNPANSVVVSYNQAKMAERMYLAVMEEHAQAMEAAFTGDLSGIVKGCEDVHDQPNCPFNDMCFSRDGVKEINQLFKKTHGRLPIL